MKIPNPTIRKRARIEIIPLIDIIFFLLATFVMVSLSMVKNQGVSVNLPSANTATPLDRKEQAIITITENGLIYLNKEITTLERLSAQLGTLKIQNSDLQVFINGDAKAFFGTAITVLDEVRKLGISKIAIQTKKIEPQKSR
jgi:biopolymer transport protein ExbD